MGLPRRRVDEMLEVVGLTGSRGRPPDRQLLPRHAAAARHRARPPRRPAGADPGRARQRARPGRHPLDARTAQGVRRARRHRAAVLAPAARDRGGRRPPGGHRPRRDRRRRQQGRAADRAGTLVRGVDADALARCLDAAGLRLPATPDGAYVVDAHRRADRDRRRTQPASSSPISAPPTAPGSRTCSCSSPPTTHERRSPHEHRHPRRAGPPGGHARPERHRGPVQPTAASRAAQAGRHPSRLLAARRDRHHHGRRRRRVPVRRGRGRLPTCNFVGVTATPQSTAAPGARHPRGHHRVVAAHRPGDVHPGAEPSPHRGRQAGWPWCWSACSPSWSRSASQPWATSCGMVLVDGAGTWSIEGRQRP